MTNPEAENCLAILKEKECFLRESDYELIHEKLTQMKGNVHSQDDYIFHGMAYHSSRNPEREAEKQAQSLDKGKYLVCCSVGAGFICSYLKRFERILLIEPDVQVFLTAVKNGFLLKIAERLKIFLPDLSYADELEAILPWLQGRKMSQIMFYFHRAAFNARPNLYIPLKQRLESLLEKRAINQATIIKFQELWNKNILMNSQELLQADTILSVFVQKPPAYIVIAGAGPSLSQSFAELRKYRTKFILFCADTSFIPLVREKIIPDFVFSADPQWINHFYAMSVNVSQSAWVIDPVVNPQIAHFLQRNYAKIFAWNNAFYADEILREITGDRGEISHGGSVSTNAFDFAVRWGAQNIILTGQDLSFSFEQAHMRGAVLETAVFLRNHRLFSYETHNYRQLNALPKIPVPAINNEETPGLFTNAKMNVFIKWFEAKASEYLNTGKNIQLYNASANGVRIKGFKHQDLSTILIDKPNEQKLPAPHSNTLKIPLDNYLNKVNQLHNHVQSLRNLYHENAKLSRQLVYAESSNSLISKLNKNDEKIKSYAQANRFISLNAQAQILEITEGDADIVPDLFYSTMEHCCKLQLIYLDKIRARLSLRKE